MPEDTPFVYVVDDDRSIRDSLRNLILARRGYDLNLVARHRERLEALAQRLTRETGRTVELVVADLTDRSDRRNGQVF